jgi:hypothetical protein
MVMSRLNFKSGVVSGADGYTFEMTRPPEREPAARRAAIAVTALLAAGCLAFALVDGPAPLAGDDIEYKLSLQALVRNGSPVVDDAVLRGVIGELEGVRVESFPLAAQGLFPDGRFETLHFWFYSALAVPFHAVARAAGLDWRHAFTLLNITLLAGATYTVARWLGTWGAVLFAAGLAAAPLSPYYAKAHVEILVVSALAAAFTLLLADRAEDALVWLALMAAQVTAIIPWAAAVLAWVVWRRRLRGGQWWRAAAAAVLIPLQPLWTMWRHGTWNLIAARGFVRPDMVGTDRLGALFVDPDGGVLGNWPVALVCVVLAAGGLFHARGRLSRPWLAFMVSFLVLMPLLHAQQANYTTSVARYSLWYIPPLLVAAIESLRLAGRRASVAGGLVLVAGFAGTFWMNYVWNDRHHIQLRRAFSSEWFHEKFPGAYHPVRQIWLDLSLRDQIADPSDLRIARQYVHPRLHEMGVWAASNAGCNKLLILSGEALRLDPPVRKPSGCQEAVDGTVLLRELKDACLVQWEDAYIIVPREMLQAAIPVLEPGSAAEFIDEANDKYLGRGWSNRTEWGWWSEGYRATIAFRLQGGQGSRLRMRGRVAASQGGSQQVDVHVNGAPAETLRSTGFDVWEVAVPYSAGAGGVTRIEFRIHAPFTGGSLCERYGVGLGIERMLVEP